jgi:hypothetical protein
MDRVHHAQLGIVLSKYDNLAEATARTQVFDPNPLAQLSDWTALAERPRRRSGTLRQARRPPDAAYRDVILRGIRSNGLLDGPRVSTSLTRSRVRFRGRAFTRAERLGFEEAMVYYHVDAAIRYIESLGTPALAASSTRLSRQTHEAAAKTTRGIARGSRR